MVYRTPPGAVHGQPWPDAPPCVIAFAPDIDSIAAATRHMARTPDKLVLVAIDPVRADATPRPPSRWLVQHLLGHAAVRLATGTVTQTIPGARGDLGLLHVVLTAAVSLSLSTDQACFYENGVANLGLPVTTTSLASAAVRSVHPEIAAALSRLVSRMSRTSFAFENPFLDRTPTEVVQDLIDSAADAGDEPRGRLDAFHSFARNENQHPTRIDQCLSTMGALLSRPAHFAWGERAVLPELLAPMNENLADAFIRAIRDLPELRVQLDTANDNNDLGLAERAQQEIDALEVELRRCLSLGGRQREASALARARKAVSNAVHRALQRIRDEHPPLAAHLDAALRIGIYLCYAPGEDMAWLT